MDIKPCLWFLILGIISFGVMSCAITVPVAYIPPVSAPTILGVAMGEACDFGFLGFPPLADSDQASLERAMAAAVAFKGGDALVNATIDYRTEYYILFSKRCTRVRGTVVRTK